MEAVDSVRITLKKETINLKVSVLQRETTPGGIVNVVVQATRDGQPVSGLPVELEAKGIEGTGGHDHIGNRPKGSFNSQEGKTDGNGKFTTDYTASEFGGIERIIVKSTETKSRDSVDVTVKVAGLIKVPSSANYELKGQTTTHPDNHYIANQAALDSLTSAAKAFKNQSWNTTGKMRLNDISLKNGGGFDINGNWLADIVEGGRGHKSHREGRNIDIENLALEDTTVTIIDKKTGQQKQQTVRVADVDWVKRFKEFMIEFKWDFFDEGQTDPNLNKRTRRFPHFNWRGK